MPIALVIAAAFGIGFFVVWKKWRAAMRADFIRMHALPRGLFEKLCAKHPSLTPKDCQLVAHALRHFFLAHLKSGHKFVSMPSQVADDLWHEFILHTREYAFFCQQAFGRFMHHTPAEALGSNKVSNAGLRRCWWYVCLEENISPTHATRLPLLFALDSKLNIPKGFRYAINCGSLKDNNRKDGDSATYCSGDFSDPNVDGSTEGFGDAPNASGCGGGGGCSGGCGGGD